MDPALSSPSDLTFAKYTFTEDTKSLFKGSKNNFFGKTHSELFKQRLSVTRKGFNNPLFSKPKSEAFIYHLNKDRSGPNNPMFGKPKSSETLSKISKRVYVFDAKTRLLVFTFHGLVETKKKLKMGYDTLKRALTTQEIKKDKYIFSHSNSLPPIS